MLFNAVPMRTRRALLLYKACGVSTLHDSQQNLLNIANALLVLSWQIDITNFVLKKKKKKKKKYKIQNVGQQ